MPGWLIMNFCDLRQRLIEDLRRRVRSGELTERRLARQTGISQPHIHQVLKGKRALSTQKADEILSHLRLDLLDLVDVEELLESRRRR
jgi:predicted transcriptional regulator